MSDMVIYGAGKRGNQLCNLLLEAGISCSAVLDVSSEKIGKVLCGMVIESPDSIKKYNNITVCITIADKNIVHDVREKLRALYGEEDFKEISYNALILKALCASKKIKKYVDSLEAPQGKKNNLFVCYDIAALGGIEAWTINVCSGLIDIGMNNIYILSDCDASRVDGPLSDRIVRPCLPRAFSSDSMIDIMGVIYKHMPCRVITSQPDAYLIAAFLLKQRFPEKIDVVSGIRGGSESIYEAYMDFRVCTDVYVGVSNDIKRALIERGVPEASVFTMHVPFYCDEHLEREYSTSSSIPLRIGYAGRLDGFQHSQKRMDLLLCLIEEIASRDLDFTFTIAGDGTVRKEMEEFVEERGLGGCVRFLGRLNKADIPCFWKQQDICVNMADLEGRSISIVEAMGHGAVPVVTDTSGVRDDILDGRNGYIVPIGDFQKAADRIEYLAGNRYLLPQMGKLAHEVVYPTSRRDQHLDFWKKMLLD